MARSPYFITGVSDRVYDLAQNGFTLQRAGITINKTPDEGMGFLVNFVLGRDAFTSSSYGINPNKWLG